MSAWKPVSGCGPACRTGDDEQVGRVRAALRLGALLVVLMTGLIVVPLLRGAALQTVSRAMLASLGVRFAWRGPAPRPGSLLVANHESWLDIVAAGWPASAG
jgi:1-acyl-sn-glycerol-3-phosphate acyltransferase